jgi:hypothetical protein
MQGRISRRGIGRAAPPDVRIPTRLGPPACTNSGTTEGGHGGALEGHSRLELMSKPAVSAGGNRNACNHRRRATRVRLNGSQAVSLAIGPLCVLVVWEMWQRHSTVKESGSALIVRLTKSCSEGVGLVIVPRSAFQVRRVIKGTHGGWVAVVLRPLKSEPARLVAKARGLTIGSLRTYIQRPSL